MIRSLLVTAVDIYSLILFAAVILSWVSVDPSNPLVRFIRGATEPVLARVRRVLPPMGGIDLSPLVVFFVLRLLIRFI